MKECSIGGGVEVIRREKDVVGVTLRGCMIGDVSINEWLCLRPCAVSAALGVSSSPGQGEQGMGSKGEHDRGWSLLCSVQSKPLPIDVTPQLPTLAAL